MSHVEILKLHSLKATPQRLSVLGVLEKYGHVTLDEIEKHTKKQFPTLSLSTIYRNINDMIKKNILSEVKFANKKEYYEIKKKSHAHLICKKCGLIDDFKLDTKNILKTAQKSTNSTIQSTTIYFETICQECLA